MAHRWLCTGYGQRATWWLSWSACEAGSFNVGVFLGGLHKGEFQWLAIGSAACSSGGVNTSIWWLRRPVMGQFNLGDCETAKPKAAMFNIPDELDGKEIAVRIPVGWQSLGMKEDDTKAQMERDGTAKPADGVYQPLGVFSSPILPNPEAGLVAWVVACVEAFPGRTPRELANTFSGGDHKKFNRRLPEAEKKGLVRRGVVRQCAVSGFATEWWPNAEKSS